MAKTLKVPIVQAITRMISHEEADRNPLRDLKLFTMEQIKLLVKYVFLQTAGKTN